MYKPIMHIVVKDDQHGNPPSQSQINSIAKKFRLAASQAGNSHIVVVTNDRVKMTIIRD